MAHAGARTTVHGRKLVVARWLAGWRQAHIAAATGISQECVRTWITRYAAEGEAGLVDRSSRPHASLRRTSVELQDRIVELRRRQRRGPAWISAELDVPVRTVSRASWPVAENRALSSSRAVPTCPAGALGPSASP